MKKLAGAVILGLVVAGAALAQAPYSDLAAAGQPGAVKDVVKSEAGLATLMDRKVNTGTLNPFTLVLLSIATRTGADSPEDLAEHELEIVGAMRYRRDYLGDESLSQPVGRIKP
jgi:hypothetical protein